ncbi:hypothetical protein [Actinokineospora sp. NBRC 105648]|uniref:hypothetical protein n=1 Tax=Actinokineospora sp. NBRC 105648 TaxID=3032206 RepID=UPI0024A015E1|nr:hypothetical protein [Actinokineospora sp. NBRC 105648]GLZ39095.1 hypothetical protein Acsp05_27190 [Actinokineospora sp. NBRC 105648]
MRPTDLDVLVGELKRLRRGRGVHAPGVADGLGAAVLALGGIVEGDDDVATRRKLVEALGRLADGLPGDLRICFTAAFGLAPQARFQFYQERLKWAGAQLGREVRTVRRRVDEAIVCAAQLATTRQADRPRPGWHTAELRATVTLTGDGEVYEFRRIVADRDGLRELDLGWSVTPTPGLVSDVDTLGVELIHGGTLARRSRAARHRIATTVRLPEPLTAGQHHEIALRVVPGGRQARPHYVCTPHGRCDRFELRVVFPDAPSQVLVIDGVPNGEVEDDLAPRRVLPVGSSTEVGVAFTDLVPYLSYGLRWP